MTGDGTVLGPVPGPATSGPATSGPAASGPAASGPAPSRPAPSRSSVIVTIAALTARSLLGRRRSVLLVLLALLPVAAAILVRVSGREASVGEEVATAIMDRLLVTTLLPIVGLVFGTAALGAELEDGTAVFLLVKPIDRWRIVVAKLIVAVGLSIALVAPAAFLAGAILGPGGTGLSGAVGAAVGTAIGATVYATVFFALSLVTGRALAIGLVYVLVWEGVLAGLLEGVAALSIRQYTLAISAAIAQPGVADPGLLDARVALVLSVVAVAVAVVVAVRRLSSYEIGQAGD
jgi:ABC-2 type transport system permease protein